MTQLIVHTKTIYSSLTVVIHTSTIIGSIVTLKANSASVWHTSPSSLSQKPQKSWWSTTLPSEISSYTTNIHSLNLKIYKKASVSNFVKKLPSEWLKKKYKGNNKHGIDHEYINNDSRVIAQRFNSQLKERVEILNIILSINKCRNIISIFIMVSHNLIMSIFLQDIILSIFYII